MAEMLEVAAWIAAPVLAGSLLVGLLISIFQVVTQIQEMTLTFVPKLIAAVIILIVMGHWMLSLWKNFAIELISNIPNM
nr:flagellar biosynthetic protein FliQ [Pleionea sp. CnH1-48]